MKRNRLTLHLEPFFADVPLSKICSSEVERYKKTRLGENARRDTRRKGDAEGITKYASGKPINLTKPGTINRELATLSHLLTKAVEWGWIQHKPKVIRKLKEGAGRITYLTIEQAEALLDAARADENVLTYPFVLIGLRTGMRRMEILSIERKHVDLERKSIHIPKAKAGPRDQPITDDLATYLTGYVEAMPKGEEWLFASANSASGHLGNVHKAIRRTATSAGLDPDIVTPHVLRHTAITHLVQAGVDLPTVKRISGHKTLIMVERYAHANGEHIQAAMDKLQSRYDQGI